MGDGAALRSCSGERTTGAVSSPSNLELRARSARTQTRGTQADPRGHPAVLRRGMGVVDQLRRWDDRDVCDRAVRHTSAAGSHDVGVGCARTRGAAQRLTGCVSTSVVTRFAERTAPSMWLSQIWEVSAGMGPAGRVSHGWYRLSNPVGGRGRQPLCQGSVAQSFST